jgi:ABC-type Fe3+/spermidine/putrescine transport system ATPase subunit
MALLEIRGVSKQFVADGNEMRALQDVNRDIDANEFVCFIGPSGCSKTTPLRISPGRRKRRAEPYILTACPYQAPARKLRLK